MSTSKLAGSMLSYMKVTYYGLMSPKAWYGDSALIWNALCGEWICVSGDRKCGVGADHNLKSWPPRILQSIGEWGYLVLTDVKETLAILRRTNIHTAHPVIWKMPDYQWTATTNVASKILLSSPLLIWSHSSFFLFSIPGEKVAFFVNFIFFFAPVSHLSALGLIEYAPAQQWNIFILSFSLFLSLSFSPSLTVFLSLLSLSLSLSVPQTPGNYPNLPSSPGPAPAPAACWPGPPPWLHYQCCEWLMAWLSHSAGRLVYRETEGSRQRERERERDRKREGERKGGEREGLWGKTWGRSSGAGGGGRGVEKEIQHWMEAAKKVNVSIA